MAKLYGRNYLYLLSDRWWSTHIPRPIPACHTAVLITEAHGKKSVGFLPEDFTLGSCPPDYFLPMTANDPGVQESRRASSLGVPRRARRLRRKKN